MKSTGVANVINYGPVVFRRASKPAGAVPRLCCSHAAEWNGAMMNLLPPTEFGSQQNHSEDVQNSAKCEKHSHFDLMQCGICSTYRACEFAQLALFFFFFF